jgi:hypothetical protein
MKQGKNLADVFFHNKEIDEESEIKIGFFYNKTR